MTFVLAGLIGLGASGAHRDARYRKPAQPDAPGRQSLLAGSRGVHRVRGAAAGLGSRADSGAENRYEPAQVPGAGVELAHHAALGTGDPDRLCRALAHQARSCSRPTTASYPFCSGTTWASCAAILWRICRSAHASRRPRTRYGSLPGARSLITALVGLALWLIIRAWRGRTATARGRDRRDTRVDPHARPDASADCAATQTREASRPVPPSRPSTLPTQCDPCCVPDRFCRGHARRGSPTPGSHAGTTTRESWRRAGQSTRPHCTRSTRSYELARYGRDDPTAERRGPAEAHSTRSRLRRTTKAARRDGRRAARCMSRISLDLGLRRQCVQTRQIAALDRPQRAV